MNENEKKTPESELTDDKLYEVSGGASRQDNKKAECENCGKLFPAASLLGGYCKNCLDELRKIGVNPLI